jgi:UDP-N-acetyl-D-mannosaminuronic acid transferase (WecB/TagA/CpsF family)
MPLLAVGAAFDFHAGTQTQAPEQLQRMGLEWFYRLVYEPRRLWRRYLLLNPHYAYLVILQWLRLRSFPLLVNQPPQDELRYG